MSVVHSSAPFWQDPGSIAINRRNSHVPLHSFRSPASAVQRLSTPPGTALDAPDAAQAPYQAQHDRPRVGSRQELSGCEWAFKVFPNPASVPDGFWGTGYDDSGFGTVRSAGMAQQREGEG